MSDFQSQRGPDAHADAAHERSDVKPGMIVAFVVALVVVTVVVMLILAMIMRGFSGVEKDEEKLRPDLFKDEIGQFPQPRSQETPRTDLARFREAERKITDTYGWVDGKAGIARIPVDRAIDILSERGLPKGRNTPPRGSRTRDQK